MTMPDQPKNVAIFCQDLTVGNADQVSDFYLEAVGWTHIDHDIGGYADYNYNMNYPELGETVVGICRDKGPNTGLHPECLAYIAVAEVEQSINKCLELGGQVVNAPHIRESSQFCVIQDPAGCNRINQPLNCWFSLPE